MGWSRMETYKPKRKGLPTPDVDSNLIWEFPLTRSLPHTLVPRERWFVRVCSFTFVFHSITQLEACLNYYKPKTRPSSRILGEDLFDYGGDHGERQRWFERLPMYLLEEPKRKKVVAALRQAFRRWTADEEQTVRRGRERRSVS
jgi:hypothetical protein